MRVLNLTEAKVETCRCESWLRHWEAFGRQRAGYCMVVGCKGKPEIGGQVQKPGERGKVYIVPLCRDCAGRYGMYLEIADGVSLVPAEIEATCGQRDTAPVRVQVVHGKGECCREDGGLEQWEASSRQRAGTCMVVGCDGKPEIGARVERIGDPGRVYLVPLCKACAARQADVLTIVRGVRLVPAEVRDTRGSRPVFAVRLADLGSTRYEGCSCGSWLEHWETFSSQRAGYCLVDGCHGMPEIGAAVQRPGEPGNVYIVPMCKACADKRDETLELANGAHLVPADVRDTCAVADEAEEIHWTTNVA